MSDRPVPSATEKMRNVALGEGSSPTGSRWLFFLGSSLSAFLLAGACLCGGAWIWFRPEVRADSQRAEQAVREMVTMQIPETLWVPRGTIEWNLAFLFQIRGAYFQRNGGEGVLAIVEVHSRISAADDVRKHIRDTLLTEGIGDTPLTVDPTRTTEHHFVIRGHDATFTFEVVNDPPRVFHLVEGVFQGDQNRSLLLTLRVPEDQWNEAEVLRMLNSIQGSFPADNRRPPGG